MIVLRHASSIAIYSPVIVSKRNYLSCEVYTKIPSMPKESIALFCPLQGVIDIISKKWALLIVNEIGNHRRIRFSELKNELRGITSKSLTNTLNDLQDNGLVVREAFNETPPRVEYRLSKDGIELYRVIIPLLQWASSRKGAVVKECSCKALKNLDHSRKIWIHNQQNPPAGRAGVRTSAAGHSLGCCCRHPRFPRIGLATPFS